jgi:hypothetical protein
VATLFYKVARFIYIILFLQAAKADVMMQRQELEQAVKELHDHIEQAERKDSEKLVAGRARWGGREALGRPLPFPGWE